MRCEEYIQKYLDRLKSGFICLALEDYIKIISPYCYPDNDFIEIYIRENHGTYTITDLGETLRHLYSQGYDVFATPRRKYLFDAVVSNSDAQFKNGKLIMEVPEEQIGEAIFEIITVSMAIGDFIFTSKSYEPATFVEEVENFLNEENIKYKENISFAGKSGTIYPINFELFDHNKTFLDVLSPKNERGLKNKVNSIFRKYYDIDNNIKKLSLLNDLELDWRDSDILLLGQVSEVIFWSKRDKIVEIVRNE